MSLLLALVLPAMVFRMVFLFWEKQALINSMK